MPLQRMHLISRTAEIDFDARQVRKKAFYIRLYGAARASLDRGPCPDAGNIMKALETIGHLAQFFNEIKMLLVLGL